jgi:hypothetical protein
MVKCGQCGEELRRVHRTFLERFNYMAIYECHICKRKEFAPRPFRYHLGPACRCPVCGTFKVVRLKERDRIDRFHTGFLHWLKRLAAGSRLFHCRWCRIQFYDSRKLASELSAPAPKGNRPEITPPDGTEPAK